MTQEEIFEKHLNHFSRYPFKASIDHFMQTGKPNGSFLEALKAICKDNSIELHLKSINLMKERNALIEENARLMKTPEEYEKLLKEKDAQIERLKNEIELVQRLHTQLKASVLTTVSPSPSSNLKN